MRGYPTVLYLDPDGVLVEAMCSREPAGVAAQMSRIARDQDPDGRLEETLAGVSGRPWDWLMENESSIETLLGVRGLLAWELDAALRSPDLEVRLRAARIRSRFERESPPSHVVRLPPADVSRWLDERLDALGENDWAAREDATKDLSRFVEAVQILIECSTRTGR